MGSRTDPLAKYSECDPYNNVNKHCRSVDLLGAPVSALREHCLIIRVAYLGSRYFENLLSQANSIINYVLCESIGHHFQSPEKKPPSTIRIMTFQVLEVDLSSSDDWEQFYAAQWETWRMGSSSQPIWKLMLPPNIGIGDDTEFEAMKASSARTLENSKADPHDHWVKVVDADTGEIVAGALWKIFDSNPYRAPFAPFDAVWHPPGQMRQMCNQMNTQLRACRPRFMAAAHACKRSLCDRLFFLQKWLINHLQF